ERFILEPDIGEPVSIPQLLQLVGDASRLEPEPASPVDGRVCAECAAEATALRGDVIELPLAFQRKIALDVEKGVVVRWERVDIAHGARRAQMRTTGGVERDAAGDIARTLTRSIAIENCGER